MIVKDGQYGSQHRLVYTQCNNAYFKVVAFAKRSFLKKKEIK